MNDRIRQAASLRSFTPVPRRFFPFVTALSLLSPAGGTDLWYSGEDTVIRSWDNAPAWKEGIYNIGTFALLNVRSGLVVIVK